MIRDGGWSKCHSERTLSRPDVPDWCLFRNALLGKLRCCGSRPRATLTRHLAGFALEMLLVFDIHANDVHCVDAIAITCFGECPPLFPSLLHVLMPPRFDTELVKTVHVCNKGRSRRHHSAPTVHTKRRSNLVPLQSW